MKWMEAIQLQVAEKDSRAVERKILKQIKDIGDDGNTKYIKVYRNVGVKNDLSINLHWESGSIKPHGSAIGLCLVHLFRDYGLVSHSVWVER